jgi:hypothetical protein
MPLVAAGSVFAILQSTGMTMSETGLKVVGGIIILGVVCFVML